MSYIEGIQSFVDHDLVNYKIDYKLDDKTIVIVNSYDSAIHPVTRFCNRAILT